MNCVHLQKNDEIFKHNLKIKISFMRKRCYYSLTSANYLLVPTKREKNKKVRLPFPLLIQMFDLYNRSSILGGTVI